MNFFIKKARKDRFHVYRSDRTDKMETFKSKKEASGLIKYILEHM